MSGDKVVIDFFDETTYPNQTFPEGWWGYIKLGHMKLAKLEGSEGLLQRRGCEVNFKEEEQ